MTSGNQVPQGVARDDLRGQGRRLEVRLLFFEEGVVLEVPPGRTVLIPTDRLMVTTILGRHGSAFEEPIVYIMRELPGLESGLEACVLARPDPHSLRSADQICSFKTDPSCSSAQLGDSVHLSNSM